MTRHRHRPQYIRKSDVRSRVSNVQFETEAEGYVRRLPYVLIGIVMVVIAGATGPFAGITLGVEVGIVAVIRIAIAVLRAKNRKDT